VLDAAGVSDPTAERRIVTVLFGDVPGVNLFFCTMGGVPIEFMGGYDAESVPATVATGDTAEPASKD
jgi:hypothetical protein